jgi:uncharacterized repeat protein (TIGR01451 family)
VASADLEEVVVGRRIRPLLSAFAVFVLATALVVPATVLAAVPPFMGMSFNPDTIGVGDTSTLTFTIVNDETNPTLTGLGFTDVLPAGVTIVSVGEHTCGGSVISLGLTTIVLSGGTLDPVMQCHIDVTVTAPAAGTFVNTSGAVSSDNAGTGNAPTATLTVQAAPSPPTITEAFAKTTIVQGEATAMTITITNPNSSTALTGVDFSDTLPGGLAVDTPNALSNSCGGSASAPAASSHVSLSGGSLAGGASCTVSVNIVGAAAGTWDNPTGNVSATETGPGGTATAGVTVIIPGNLAMNFNPSQIQPNGTSTLSFGLFNPETAPSAINGLAFTDTLPAGLTVENGSNDHLCNVGSTLAITGGNTISVAGVDLLPGYICTFSVTVTGPADVGAFVNTTSAVTYGEVGELDPATATLTVSLATPPPASPPASPPPTTTSSPIPQPNSDPQPLLVVVALLAGLLTVAVVAVRGRYSRSR